MCPTEIDIARSVRTGARGGDMSDPITMQVFSDYV
jgi:hypothetical protein